MMMHTTNWIEQRFLWAEERIRNSHKIAADQYKKIPNEKCINGSLVFLAGLKTIGKPPGIVTIESDGGISFYILRESDKYRIVINNDGVGIISSNEVILEFNPDESIDDILAIIR